MESHSHISLLDEEDSTDSKYMTVRYSHSESEEESEEETPRVNLTEEERQKMSVPPYKLIPLINF